MTSVDTVKSSPQPTTGSTPTPKETATQFAKFQDGGNVGKTAQEMALKGLSDSGLSAVRRELVAAAKADPAKQAALDTFDELTGGDYKTGADATNTTLEVVKRYEAAAPAERDKMLAGMTKEQVEQLRKALPPYVSDDFDTRSAKLKTTSSDVVAGLSTYVSNLEIDEQKVATAVANIGVLLADAVLDLLDGKPLYIDDIETLVASTIGELKKLIEKGETGKAKNETESSRSINKEKQAQLDAAIAKLKESGALNDTSKVAQWFKVAISAIQAAITIAVGVALMSNPATAALGGLLIAKGVVDAVGVVDSVVKLATPDGRGIVGSIVKACGGSDESAGWADMGFSVGLAVTSMVLSIMAARADGAGDALGKITQLAGNWERIALDIGATTAEIASTATSLAAGVKSSDSTKIAAESQKLDALINRFMEEMEKAFANVAKSGTKFNDIIQMLVEAMNKKNDSNARMQFKA